MKQQLEFEYQGKRISAALNEAQTDSGAPLPRREPPMWYITIGGTALTKLPAGPDDTEQAVRDKILAWLQAHPDLLDRDQIVLGGG
jgi:hypothetical protein